MLANNMLNKSLAVPFSVQKDVIEKWETAKWVAITTSAVAGESLNELNKNNVDGKF